MNEIEVFSLEEMYASLPHYQATTIRTLVEKYGEEKAAEMWLESMGPKQTQHFGGSSTELVSQSGKTVSFWKRCKTEFDKLICGHKDWEKEYEEYVNYGKAISIATATGIAGVLSPVIGVTTVILIPAIELLLRTVSKMGINAYCSNKDFENAGLTH